MARKSKQQDGKKSRKGAKALLETMRRLSKVVDRAYVEQVELLIRESEQPVNGTNPLE